MATNRLLPHQFGNGNTIDGTRLEQALFRLVDLFNDVPADLVRRRWSPSEAVWGLAPYANKGAADDILPWMYQLGISASLQPVAEADIPNPQRVKSCAAAGIESAVPGGGDLFTWEVSFSPARPVVIGYLAVMAEFQATGPYQNAWKYGAVPPTGFNHGDPGVDFTLQATVDDGWDLENRRKLRQESLVWRMRSDAFLFSPTTPGAVDTMRPPSPLAVAADRPFRGFAVVADPLVLIPAGARVRFQWTIPQYGAANNSTWGTLPIAGNLWSLCAQVWEATR